MPQPTLIGIKVWLNRNGTPDKATALEELFKQKPGETQVRLKLENPQTFSVTLDVPAKVKADREFRARLEQICGPETYEVLAS